MNKVISFIALAIGAIACSAEPEATESSSSIDQGVQESEQKIIIPDATLTSCPAGYMCVWEGLSYTGAMVGFYGGTISGCQQLGEVNGHQFVARSAWNMTNPAIGQRIWQNLNCTGHNQPLSPSINWMRDATLDDIGGGRAVSHS